MNYLSDVLSVSKGIKRGSMSQYRTRDQEHLLSVKVEVPEFLVSHHDGRDGEGCHHVT